MSSKMRKYFTRVKEKASDVLNVLATISAASSVYMAISSGELYGAAFPTAVASITGLELYHPKRNFDPKTALYGIKKGAFAKGVIAIAGIISAIGDILPAEVLFPSVGIPLGLSTIADIKTGIDLKRLSEGLENKL
ncbi:MAG: hypothetical protein JSW73_01455 [Candidatus Woesearchaeota archaeon]|nr:MAG: hypothetical protein JSW73_01455 [Candidatus Woesearchaeota archaeon]